MLLIIRCTLCIYASQCTLESPENDDDHSLFLTLPPGLSIGEALRDCGRELPMMRLTLTTGMGFEKETEQFCGIPLLQRRMVILELG